MASRLEVTCRFGVETDVLPDVLLRIAGLFAVHGITLAKVSHDLAGRSTWTLITTVDLEQGRAQFLQNRLLQMPWVRSVDLDLPPVAAPSRSSARAVTT